MHSKRLDVPWNSKLCFRTCNLCCDCGANILRSQRDVGSLYVVRDSEYRELLADKIAEAIVEIRYGPGVYRAVETTSVQAPESSGPGLAPPTLRHD